MISRTTKIQLVVFVLITLIGVSYVGARYAQLDRMITDDTYTVSADMAESGGIFVGAEVTYRGIQVGRVEGLRLSSSGVFVEMGIQNEENDIPSDVIAVVANRSAVGEQYIDLQPQRKGKPYLKQGSRIARDQTQVPIEATKLLIDLDQLVNSVDKNDLRTVISELGVAFKGAGPDIGRIIDTSNSFIDTASANIGVTKSLIKNGTIALRTQLASESSIRSFTHDLRLFSTTLVNSDKDLRNVIDKGSVAARDVRQIIEDNEQDIAELVRNLITTGEITAARLDGLEQILVLYPYVVEGGYTVVSKDPLTGLYDAHFGLVFTEEPAVCHQGYDTKQRPPEDRKDRPMNVDARCTEPQAVSSARGAQNAPAYNRAPVVAQYDPRTGDLVPATADPDRNIVSTGGQQAILGKDSWQWLLLGPLAKTSR